MASPTHLKALQALEAAVRLGSVKDAAAELAITPAAAGQRITALEDHLGFALLSRGRTGIQASPQLERALPYLHTAFAGLATAASELELQRVSEIHIAAPSDFVDLWLMPRLPAFRAQYPGVLFCINGQGDVRLRLGRADCEIAFATPSEASDGVSEVLFGEFALPIGSPANVARISRLPEARRLEGFPLLHVATFRDDTAGISWPEWTARNRVARSAPDRGIRFGRLTDALDAVEADAGLCLAGLALLLDRLDAGTIKLPYPISTGRWSDQVYTARFRADSLKRKPIERFRRWLEAEAKIIQVRLSEMVG